MSVSEWILRVYSLGEFQEGLCEIKLFDYIRKTLGNYCPYSPHSSTHRPVPAPYTNCHSTHRPIYKLPLYTSPHIQTATPHIAPYTNCHSTHRPIYKLPLYTSPLLPALIHTDPLHTSPATQPSAHSPSTNYPLYLPLPMPLYPLYV